MYTSCVLWVAPLCAFSIYFTYQKKKNSSFRLFRFFFSFSISQLLIAEEKISVSAVKFRFVSWVTFVWMVH
jgi:hypothetical protein